MKKLISKDELESCLYKIRVTLCTYDFKRVSNVIFFNNEAVFEYLCEIPLKGAANITVGEALDDVSAFIPVNIGENPLMILLSAEASEFKLLEEEFTQRNKMEFLQLITRISSSSEWSCLINICEAIRMFKEKEERHAVK